MIYDMVMDELNCRYLYKHDTYGPFYVCSYAMHIFNLLNRKVEFLDTGEKISKAVYWVAAEVPDQRLHNLFIAPSGFMKTTYLRAMESILGGSGTKMVYKETMSSAGFIGTVKDNNGTSTKTVGVAEKHADDIIMINEFSAITDNSKAGFNSDFKAMILDVLDHGYVSKDLASGGFHYDTRLTLWAGVQPSHYDLASGMGRRMCPIIFLPTPKDNANLIHIKKQMSGMKIDYPKMKEINKLTKEWKESFSIIEDVSFDDSVYALHQDSTLGFWQFECDYFDRLLLGYHLAKHGPSKHVVVTANDTELIRLVTLQKEWRGMIYEGIDSIMIMNLIKSISIEMQPNVRGCSRTALANACKMISWNKKDLYIKLKEMVNDGQIKLTGETITWK